MKNPWLKKNPFLSMWLSAANSIAARARGQASAAVKREMANAARETLSVASTRPAASAPSKPARAAPSATRGSAAKRKPVRKAGAARKKAR